MKGTSTYYLTLLLLLLLGVASSAQELEVLARPESAGLQPQIMLSVDELILQPGDTLNVSCRSRQPVAWCTDHSLSSDHNEEVYEEHEVLPYVSYLTIPNINYTFVGYYSCVLNTTENRQRAKCDIDDPMVSSFYLYVKDVNHLLVQEAELHLVPHSAVVGEPFTLPCKPTFPEVNITIEKNEGILSLDPRHGYQIKKPSVARHYGLYSCMAKYQDYEATEHMFLYVKAKKKAPPRPRTDVLHPYQINHFIIDGRDHFDLLMGQSYNLSCIIQSSHDLHIRLSWSRENNAENKTHGRHQVIRSYDNGIQNRTYTINEADETDAGEYVCQATMGNKVSNSTPIVLSVIDEEEFIDMQVQKPNFTTNKIQEDIMWYVYYRSYPPPVFQLYKGDKLLHDSKNNGEGDKHYDMEMSDLGGEMFLTINSPTIEDIGLYTLVGTTESGNIKKSVQISFTMPGSPQLPELTTEPNKLLQAQDTTFRLRCSSTGYPKPNLSLQFFQCYAKNNCSHETSLDDPNNMEEVSQKSSDTLVNQTQQWMGSAHTSGMYKCTAENTHGTNTKVLFFNVTDGNSENAALSLEIEHEDVEKTDGSISAIEGDKLTVVCRGNKMLITGRPQWKINGQKMNNSTMKDQGIVREDRETNLSYVSEIRITSMKKDTSFTYMCLADDETVALNVRVAAMEAPLWKNGIDAPLADPGRSVRESEKLVLSCPASGTPRPRVTWYKDGVELNENNQPDKGKLVDGEIHFEYIMTTDQGMYKCEVRNRAGHKAAETFITVTDPDDKITRNILIVVGVLIVILVILSIIFCRKIYQDRKRELDIQKEVQKKFNEGDLASINPELSIGEQAELLPYNDKFEVPRDSIIFDKLLGAGAFGRVYQATAINLHPGQPRTTVAVKMMKSRTDNAQLKALRSEVKIMVHIGRHINIVNLLGACSKDLASKGELLLLVEYCRYGNILEYMHNHRKNFVNQINSEDKIDQSIMGPRSRNCSGTGSRGRTARGLKYAHLNFHQDSVHYTPGNNSNHSLCATPTTPTPLHIPAGNGVPSPLQSPGFHPDIQGSVRARSLSTSSHRHLTSDMSTFSYDSSAGGSDDYISSLPAGGHPDGLCSTDILAWAYQIAKGMEYLAFKKVMHGDLAARNVLLAEDNIVKISDFGLAKDIYKDENYKKKSDGPMPVKWLALESLRDGVFSTQSDVWAYGVVLWEIFSLGRSPYPGMEFDENFIVKLEKGVRLEQPNYATYELYRIMMDCWNEEPLDRPTFSQLEQALAKLLGDAKSQYYLELNKPYQEEHPSSNILDMFQQPHYNLQAEGTDADGYEMPFSPSPLGAATMATIMVDEGDGQQATPRLTSQQVMYHKHYDDGSPNATASGDEYLHMSSPTRAKDDSVFNFDRATVQSIHKRDSETLYGDGPSASNDVYLRMDSTNSSTKPKQSPLTPKVTDSPKTFSPHTQNVSHRPKLTRSPSALQKHDSGLYSPTANMQTNPNYMVMNMNKEVDQITDIPVDNAQYVNYSSVKSVSNSAAKNYMKDGTKEEYVNLVSSDHTRNRYNSEAYSDLGSMDGSPPTTTESESLLASPVIMMENSVALA